jgi:chemotaxis protein CheD
MLPESSIDEAKARQAPFMFGDTGIPLLFKETYRLGAVKNRLRVIVVGGAGILDQKGFFNIGKRNYTLLRKLFWKNNVMIDFEDVGGNVNRTLKLDVANGITWLKTSGNGTWSGSLRTWNCWSPWRRRRTAFCKSPGIRRALSVTW